VLEHQGAQEAVGPPSTEVGLQESHRATGILIGGAQAEGLDMFALFRACPDPGVSFHSMLAHPKVAPGAPVVHPVLL